MAPAVVAGRVHVARPRPLTSSQRVAPAVSCCRLSPPPVLARSRGAAGPIECVQLGHVVIGEAEVEDLCVLLDARAMGRLRDKRYLALDAPAEKHLSRRAPQPLSDARGCSARHVRARAEGP